MDTKEQVRTKIVVASADFLGGSSLNVSTGRCAGGAASVEASKQPFSSTGTSNAELLEKLRSLTGARIAVGRSGVRPTTESLLKFQADHALSRTTVLHEIPEDWLQERDLWTLHTCAKTKDEYLTRPDLGRLLEADAAQLLHKHVPMPYDVQIVVSDGLSANALLSNYDEMVPVLTEALGSAGYSVGKPFFLRHGRVRAEDRIGEILGCDILVLLIGERPGLGQSESLSCYAIYRPTQNSIEADRLVLSNIHHHGTSPLQAARLILDIVRSLYARAVPAQPTLGCTEETCLPRD